MGARPPYLIQPLVSGSPSPPLPLSFIEGRESQPTFPAVEYIPPVEPTTHTGHPGGRLGFAPLYIMWQVWIRPVMYHLARRDPLLSSSSVQHLFPGPRILGIPLLLFRRLTPTPCRCSRLLIEEGYTRCSRPLLEEGYTRVSAHPHSCRPGNCKQYP